MGSRVEVQDLAKGSKAIVRAAAVKQPSDCAGHASHPAMEGSKSGRGDSAGVLDLGEFTPGPEARGDFFDPPSPGRTDARRGSRLV